MQPGAGFARLAGEQRKEPAGTAGGEAVIESTELWDAGLSRELRAGEARAWETLYDALGKRVFRLIVRLVSDEQVARDLTHDTFVAVSERGAQYAGRGSVEGWVFRIAANTAKSWLRDTARRREIREEMLTGTTGGVLRAEAEDRIVLRQAVMELSDGQRAVLLLHEVDGYTHAEIGEMLDIAEGTSKARLSRARNALRERLRREM